MCPISKNGNRADKANNRPATQPSCIGNIFESIVRDAIYDHLQVNNILCNEQFGPGLSCFLHLLETLLEWSCMVDKGEGCDDLYVDYSKAFDTVPDERRQKELETVGITGLITMTCKCIKIILDGLRKKIILHLFRVFKIISWYMSIYVDIDICRYHKINNTQHLCV